MKGTSIVAGVLVTINAVLGTPCRAGEGTNPVPSSVVTATQSVDRVDITTQGGQVFKNAKVTRVEPDGITVMYSKGIAKIGFADLPEEYRTKYHYDPEKAASYSRTVAQKRSEVWARQQEESQRQKAASDLRQSTQELVKTIARQRMAVAGEVLQVTDDGVLLSGSVTLEESVEVDPTDKVRRFDGPTMRKVTKLKSVTAEYEPVFIVGIGAGLHDGATWVGVVYPAGTHRYTSVQGATKTVKRFATTPGGAAAVQLGE